MYRYNLPLIFRTLDAVLADAEILGYVGVNLVGETFEQFVTAIAGYLPKQIPRKTIYDSLSYLAGEVLKEEELHTVAWRLIGNQPRLKLRRCVSVWTHQASDEWVPAQIIRCDPTRDHKDRPASYVELRVLAGSPCAMRITTVWTKKFMHLVAQHLGFSNYRGDYPFSNPSQLVGMRLLIEVLQELSQGKPGFQNIRVVPAMREYNKIQLRARLRLPKGYVCPFGFGHPCHLCHVGYDQCEVATHPVTYEKRACRRCKQQGWFDPSRPKQTLCVNCAHRKAMQPRTKPKDNPS